MSKTQADYLREHQADSHQVPNAGLDEFLKQMNSRGSGRTGQHLPGTIGEGGATADDSQRRTLPGKASQATDPDESQRSILPQKVAPGGSPFDLHPVLPPHKESGDSKPLPSPGDFTPPNEKAGDSRPLPAPSKDFNDVNKMLDGFFLTDATR